MLCSKAVCWLLFVPKACAGCELGKAFSLRIAQAMGCSAHDAQADYAAAAAVLVLLYRTSCAWTTAHA